MRSHAQYLMVWDQTQSVARTADILGCSRRVIYHHLHRAGIHVRPYIRRPTLRLVTTRTSFEEWQYARKRAIDSELTRLRAAWRRELDRAAKSNS